MTENYLNILAETIRNNWDQPALTDFYLTEDGTAQDTSRGNHYTYGEMYSELCRVADLLTSLGLKKGDHIAICGANSAHWAIAYLAIAKMQGVSVTVMHTLMPDEIARLVNFSDAKALFTDPDIWSDLSPIALGVKSSARLDVQWTSIEQKKGVRCVLSLADWSLLDGYSDRAMSERRPREDRDISFPQSEPDDLQTICFTSGSTGAAKGVMLSYGNISASVRGVAESCVLHKNKKAVSFLPLSHAYVLGGQVLTPLSYGACVYSLCGCRLPEQMFLSIAMIQPYAVFLVPMLVAKLSDAKNISMLPMFTRTLEYMVIGGAEFPIQIEKALAEMRIPIAPGYGVTETAALISLSPFSDHRLGASGRIIQTLQARISPAGEILVKGENVMLGYYKDPEATARKIDADGWLHTGDKGHLDEDGYLYVEGRLEQDIIVLPNGENIRPDNIESLINALPEVSESIVLARDGHLVAIVVPSSPLALGVKSSARLDVQWTSIEQKKGVRLSILRAVNPALPLFSQLYDVEITDQPLARTEKQTIKRYLYK